MENPLYIKIYSELIKKIQMGEWKPGDLLPTEQKLQEMYGVSRTPVRHALEKLKNDGFIISRPGKGTYVSTPIERIQTAWRFLTGFEPYYVKYFNEIRATLLKLEQVQPPESVSDFFSLTNGELTISLERLRLVNDEPVAFLHHYISPNLGISKDIILKQPEFRSMTVLFEQMGFFVTTVQEQVSAVSCPERIANFLHIPLGEPILKIERKALDAAERPLEFVEYYVRSDQWKYNAWFRR